MRKIPIHSTVHGMMEVVWTGTTENMMNVMATNTVMMEMMENLMMPSIGATRMR